MTTTTEEEILKTMDKKYNKLKTENKLNLRQTRNTDLKNSVIMKNVRNCLNMFYNVDKKTSIPFDIMDFKQDVSLDFPHYKDKFIRCVKISLLQETDFKKLKSVYGTETTKILNKSFNNGQFTTEINKETENKEICFLSIDLNK